MESTLDIILAIIVLATINVINEISPYLGFGILVFTFIYLGLKIFYIIKNKGK